MLSVCAIAYVETRKRYSDTVLSQSHFMSLYKTTVMNRFHDLSLKDYRKRMVTEVIPFEEFSSYHEGDLLVNLDRLSKDTKGVLTILWNSPVEVLHTIEKDFSIPGTFFKKIALFCGIPITRAEKMARNLRKLLKIGEPMKSVYQELIDAAKTVPGYVEPKTGDSKESTITNLLMKISEVSEEVWAGLSAPAIAWHTAAAETFNANAQNPEDTKPLPEIPGYQAPVVVAPPAAEAAKPVKVKKEKVAKAPKPPKAKKEKVVKEKTPADAEAEADDTPERPKEGQGGVTLAIREMIVVDPNITVDAIAAQLKNLGFQTDHKSGIVTERHIIRSAVRLATKNGLWNGKALVEDERKPRAPRKKLETGTATQTQTEPQTVAEPATATLAPPPAPVQVPQPAPVQVKPPQPQPEPAPATTTEPAPVG